MSLADTRLRMMRRQRRPGSAWWFQQMRQETGRADGAVVHRCPRCGCRNEPAGELCGACLTEAQAAVARKEVAHA